MGIQTLDQFIGQVVSHCHVEELVRYGQMEAIYRAQQLRPSRPVAITLFQLPETLSPLAYQRFRARFLREAASLVLLRHPHLLPLYGYGEWEHLLYLITPYRTEGSLMSQLQQQGSFSLAKTVTVLEQVTAGLEYAHQHGQSHGALTPEYILVSDEYPLQIAGLGLRSLLTRRDILPITENAQHLLTVAGTQLVASKYAAPEILQSQIADIRSDVYALGVILMELLSGSLLASEATPLDELQDATLPHTLKQVLLRALATDPNNRFQQVGDLLTAWTSGVEQEHTSVKPAPTVTPVPVALTPAFQETDEQRLADEAWSASSFEQRQPVLAYQSVPSPIAARNRSGSKRSKKDSRVQRRQVTALLAGGLALGALGVGGISLFQRLTNGQSGSASSPLPSGKGTIIGQTNQATNTAVAFNDLRVPTHRQRLLIRLPTGNFVAYKQGCTHSGVLVNYDPKTHLLVCPAHGAIFDPAHGGRVVQGPANQSASSIPPLPQITISVNANGTITAL